MPPHDEFEGVTAEFCSSGGREERIGIGSGPFLEPDFQNLERFMSQWCTALLSTFALTADVSSRSGHDIATTQVD